MRNLTPVRFQKPPIRVHLTGFRPFGKYQTNPSASIVNAIDASMLERASGHRVRLKKWVLPVDRRFVTSWIERTSKQSVDLILHLGLADQQPYVRLEHLASNRCVDCNDPSEIAASVKPLKPHGPSRLKPGLPFRDIRRKLRLRHTPYIDSYDAGLYACNQVLYESLHRKHSRKSSEMIGFVHLPPFRLLAKGIATKAIVEIVVTCVQRISSPPPQSHSLLSLFRDWIVKRKT